MLRRPHSRRKRAGRRGNQGHRSRQSVDAVDVIGDPIIAVRLVAASECQGLAKRSPKCISGASTNRKARAANEITIATNASLFQPLTKESPSQA